MPTRHALKDRVQPIVDEAYVPFQVNELIAELLKIANSAGVRQSANSL